MKKSNVLKTQTRDIIFHDRPIVTRKISDLGNCIDLYLILRYKVVRYEPGKTFITYSQIK